MPNTQVFSRSTPGKLVEPTDAVNNAGGVAYALSDEAALATLCCTGTIHNTYYVDAAAQFNDVMELCDKVTPAFIAKAAIYSRTKGFMKDMPCLLLAILLTKDTALFKKAFPKVIDNVKMLRSFVQIMRSGAIGRKSFGGAAKKCIRQWFAGWKDANKFFNSTVGNNPSIGDIIRLTHPKPQNQEFEALFAYLCGFPYDAEKLPEIVKRYELFKKNYAEGIIWQETPDINFQYLTSLPLTQANWADIACKASWQTTRMNLNAFAKHSVFVLDANDTPMVDIVANRLRDPKEIAKAKVFPYQLLQAFKMADDLPHNIREALQDAMEISVSNVPTIKGKVIIAIDSSGSMDSPVTGNRGAQTSKVLCQDVAGLVGAAIKRKNPDAVVLSFDMSARKETVNSRDSVMTIAKQLSRSGGGTDISCAIRLCNDENINGDLFVIVSDNESWFDRGGYTRGTWSMAEWNKFKVRNPNARCVCIDIQPNRTTQLKERDDITNIGGFSDNVFSLLATLTEGSNENHFVNTINGVEM